jgi:hypothetical protein
MDEIERLADLSVKRGCAFALLAISTVMTGLAGTPLLALKSGAILLGLMVVVLTFRALFARNQSCRRTEVWIMLGQHRRPPEALAQRVISDALQAAYWRYAEFAAIGSMLLWVLALVLWIFGTD